MSQTNKPVIAVDLDDLSGAIKLLLVLTRTLQRLNAFSGVQQLSGGTVTSWEALRRVRVGGRHHGIESGTGALDLR